MGFFSRRASSTAPDNLALVLADWGRAELDQQHQPSEETLQFIGSTTSSIEQSPEKAGLYEAIKEAGVLEGEYTAVGACEVLWTPAFDSYAESGLETVEEARVKFLVRLGAPRVLGVLNGKDVAALERAEPGGYKRLRLEAGLST